MDIAGPFPRACGYAYLLTYIYLASRYPEAVSLKCATAQEYAKELLDIIARNRVPGTILSDQGSPFMGYMKCLCKRLGVEQIRTTPYRPQSNDVVEHFHGILVPLLRKLTEKQLDWPTQLKFALFNAVR